LWNLYLTLIIVEYLADSQAGEAPVDFNAKLPTPLPRRSLGVGGLGAPKLIECRRLAPIIQQLYSESYDL
jgi:hypothetical protein